MAKRRSIKLSALCRAAFAVAMITIGGVKQAPAQMAGDPPSRAGRIAVIKGDVSFRPSYQDGWDQAMLNYPLTTGDALWTEPGARAAVEVASSGMTLDFDTELDIVQLDQRGFVAAVPEGAVYLHVRALTPGDRYEVRTPRGLVQIGAPGRYAIGAGDSDDPTTITVVDGAARVSGDNITLDVGSGQTASLTGGGPYSGTLLPTVQGPFLTAMLAEDVAPAPVEDIPAPVRQMTGWQQLSAYGTWASVPQYGSVWYPRVDPGWAPYREGSWQYVQPWGWTWVDAEPWGFAPFHYGRWAQIGPRWAWVPVDPRAPATVRPVYAPAMVNFFQLGISSGGISLGISAGSRPVGWVPLAPGEIYYPAYRASPVYVREVNVAYVRDVTRIRIREREYRDIRRFANRDAYTVVPADVMAGGRPVRPAFRRLDRGELARARPLAGRAPVAWRSTARPEAGRRSGPARDPGILHGGRVPLREAGQVREHRRGGGHGAEPVHADAPAPIRDRGPNARERAPEHGAHGNRPESGRGHGPDHSARRETTRVHEQPKVGREHIAHGPQRQKPSHVVPERRHETETRALVRPQHDPVRGQPGPSKPRAVSRAPGPASGHKSRPQAASPAAQKHRDGHGH